MGLIKNAMTQGVQLSRHLGSQMTTTPMKKAVDVAIVGSGPAGLATALGLRAANLSFRVLEQQKFGGSVAQYPRQKIVMSERLNLPLVGEFGRSLISKEELLETFQDIAATANLQIEEGVKVTGIEGGDNRFILQTTKGPVYARKVVLATGRRGSPRKLGVPGEDLPKVAYGMLDADQYAGCSVLVVGGGDSALEAAIQLANDSDAKVAISYRGSAFGKTRQANREKLEALQRSRRVQVLLDSVVTSVQPDSVDLHMKGRELSLPNDYVIACLGGELPTEFLKGCGVEMKRFHGESLHDHAKGPARAARAGSARTEKERKYRRFSMTLFGIGLVIIAGLTLRGWHYYLLPAAARPTSPDHKLLKPSGLFGHWVGIVATGVMMLNYLYAMRKRWSRAKGWGDIRYWLGFHVFVGSLSPMVIAFHAAFQSNNLLATSTAASMLVLVSTGLMGRYLVRLVPMQDGKPIGIDDLKRQLEGLKAQLASLLRGAEGDWDLDSLVESGPALAGGGAFASLGALFPADTFYVARLVRKARKSLGGDARLADVARSLSAMMRVRTQIRFYGALRRYLAVWRVLHVGLSFFMVVLIVAHVGVSLYLGFNPFHSH